MNEFRDRLDRVLCGRKIHPWAASLGVSKGAAESMSKGTIPGPEILTTISKLDNIDLSWLVTGRGTPYRVEYCVNDQAFIYAMDDLDPINNEWAINVVSDEQQLVIIAAKFDTHDYKDKELGFLDYRVITGALGEESAELLRKMYTQYTDELSIGWQLTLTDSGSISFLASGITSPNTVFPSENVHDVLQTTITSEMREGTLEVLIRVLNSIKSTRQNPFKRPIKQELAIHPELMRSIVALVEKTAIDEGIELSIDDKAKVYTSAYRHAQRRGMTPDDLDSSNILSILEVL